MRALVLTGVVAGLAALFLSAPRAAAQGRAGTDRPVDRIVAIVGTKPILASQVEEQLVLAQSQGVKMPEDSAGRDAARRQVLSQMVDEELLVQQAERDTTIKVTDQEVQDAVEQTVQNVRKQFTSIPEFQTQLRAAGFVSEEEWRRWLADQQRRAILQQRSIEAGGDPRGRAPGVRLPYNPGGARAAGGDPGPPHPDPARHLRGADRHRTAAGRLGARRARSRRVVRLARPSLRGPERAQARRRPPRFPAAARLREGHRAGHHPRVEAGV